MDTSASLSCYYRRFNYSSPLVSVSFLIASHNQYVTIIPLIASTISVWATMPTTDGWPLLPTVTYSRQ